MQVRGVCWWRVHVCRCPPPQAPLHLQQRPPQSDRQHAHKGNQLGVTGLAANCRT